MSTMTSAAPVVLACSNSRGSECFLDSEDLFDSSYVPNNPSLVLDTALWRSVSVDEPQPVVSKEVRNPEVGQDPNESVQNVEVVAGEEGDLGREQVDLISLQTVPVQDYDDEILLNSSSEPGLSTPFDLQPSSDYHISAEILNSSQGTGTLDLQYLTHEDPFQSVTTNQHHHLHPSTDVLASDTDFTDLTFSAFEPFANLSTDTSNRSNIFNPPSELPDISTSSQLLTSTTPMIHPFVGHTQNGGGAGGGGHHMADVLLSLKNPIVHPEDPTAWGGIHISQGIASPGPAGGTTLEQNHPRSTCPGEQNTYSLERQPPSPCGTPSTTSPDVGSLALNRANTFSQSGTSSFYENAAWTSTCGTGTMAAASNFFQGSPVPATISPNHFSYALQDQQHSHLEGNPWNLGHGSSHFLPNQVIASHFSPTQAFFSTSTPPPGGDPLGVSSPYHQVQEYPYYSTRDHDETILNEDKEHEEGLYGTKSPATPYETRSIFEGVPTRRTLRSCRARNLSANADLINKHIYGSNNSLDGALLHNSFGTHPNSPDSSTDNTKNICGICGKTYARPSTLKTHMRTHSGERPYRCYSCNKSFSQAANLTAHCRTHSGEKPFHCSICNRKFSQSSSVTTHMRTHSGERPYRCRLCKKAFSDSSTLTKHLRIHSGEKPYECKLCHLRFSQSGNLNRHMRIHAQTGR